MRYSKGEGIRRTSAGFSLIELLIVIAILGVLAGIVTFAVGGFAGAGEEEACKTERKTLETSLEAFKAKDRSAVNPAGPTIDASQTERGYPVDPQALEDAQLIQDASVIKFWTYTPPATPNLTNTHGGDWAIEIDGVTWAGESSELRSGKYTLTKKGSAPAGC